MNDKTVELLNKLAEKLGVAVDVLWAALIRQATIQGAISAISAMICFGILLAGFVVIQKKTTPPQPKENDYRSYRGEWDSEVAWLVYAFAFVFLGFSGVMETRTAITALFNPQYWALTQIL